LPRWWILWPALAAIACSAAPPPADPTAMLRVEIVAAHPHDRAAFTEGLVADGRTFIESAGLYGASSLRRFDPRTGETFARVALPPELFGEGLALVGPRLIQLTWREGVALVYDAASLAVLERLSYQGEGWGLCYDGEALYMSDGSDRLTVRDPATFAVSRAVQVTRAGAPVGRLNELECVGETIYANVWLTDTIVAIDKRSGAVRAVIDAAGLLSADERSGANELNGIAYDAVSDAYWITGKNWPRMFEVRFVP
jgi:glutaminyl-peptide cyclotransferase